VCSTGDGHAPRGAFDSAAGALRMAGAALDYLNSGSVADLDGAACGGLLIALGEIQAKLTAAHAGFLRRFDAAGAHDADGCGSSSAWLAARAGMSEKAARASVRQMRQLGGRPLLGTALAAGGITDSLAFTIADWTRKLPADMREETDRILLEAAAAGASLDDLAMLRQRPLTRTRDTTSMTVLPSPERSQSENHSQTRPDYADLTTTTHIRKQPEHPATDPTRHNPQLGIMPVPS